MYMLVKDIESWWHTQLAVRYGNMHPHWEEFIELFKSTYIPPTVRKRKMREFLELSQGDKTLVEYITQFHHLEKNFPHLFGLEANSFGSWKKA